MIVSKASELKQKLMALTLAYQRVFDHKNNYTKEVLEHLGKFCRANASTFHQDARIAAMLDGRREVWLEIQKFLNLDEKVINEITRVKEDVNARSSSDTTGS